MTKDIKYFEELFIKLDEKEEYVSPYLLEAIIELLERYNYEATDEMWEVVSNMSER